MPTIVLTRADNGKSIELSRGQKLSIRLPENPTTGFRWEIESAQVVTPQVEVVTFESSSYAPAADGGMGGGGERTLVFRVANPGTTRLQMKLWQPWEGNHSIVERYSLTVRVSA